MKITVWINPFETEISIEISKMSVSRARKYLTGSTSRLLLLRAKSGGKEMDEGGKEGNDKMMRFHIYDSIIQSRSWSEIIISIGKLIFRWFLDAIAYLLLEARIILATSRCVSQRNIESNMPSHHLRPS